MTLEFWDNEINFCPNCGQKSLYEHKTAEYGGCACFIPYYYCPECNYYAHIFSDGIENETRLNYEDMQSSYVELNEKHST